MGILFNNKTAKNAVGGWNFQGILNGQTITFSASIELLQDITPSISMQSAETLFQTHQSRLQRIADAKIVAQGVPEGNPPLVPLTTADMGLSA
jgi:hypothetical protein